MSLFVLVLNAATFCLVFLGAFVLAIGPRSPVNRIFGFIYLFLPIVLMAFSVFAPDAVKRSPTAFQHYFTFFYLFVCSACLHFSLVLTGRSGPKRLLVVAPLYVASAVMAAKGFLGLLGWDETAWTQGYWSGESPGGAPWYAIYILINIALINLHLAIILGWGRKISSKRIKKQTGLYFAIFFPLLNAISCIYLLSPIFADGRFAVLCLFLIAITPWIMIFLIQRFELIAPSFNVALDDIISNINDMVFILDPFGKIIKMNDECSVLLQSRTEDMVGRPFMDYVISTNGIMEAMRNIESGRLDGYHCALAYAQGEASIHTSTYFTGIRDRFRDVIGVLVVSHNNHGKAHMQAAYKLTDREFEIIELSVSGRTNADISDKLEISVRTVETHLANIYSKLGVSNKVELMGLAFKFGLIDK